MMLHMFNFIETYRTRYTQIEALDPSRRSPPVPAHAHPYAGKRA
jgi:hypothetical protein